jgi:hypothetical protein
MAFITTSLVVVSAVRRREPQRVRARKLNVALAVKNLNL